jgi:hypothetical protein
MADITALFFILMLIGIAYPALLSAWWLLFPSAVDRARTRLERTPWASFWLGIVVAILFLVPILILLNLPAGFTKFLGFVGLGVMLVLSSIGAAGQASRFAEKLNRLGAFSQIGAFLRGAVILELASFFPILGWFVIFPIATLMSLGAAAFAILHWMPRTVAPVVEVPAQA